MPKAWTVKTLDEEGIPASQILKSAEHGWARIGWSYSDDLDLRVIMKADADGRLNSEQKRAWRCRRFLTEVSREDYLVYPHQPEYGQFFVCQVTTDEYRYLPTEDSIDGDFRSARACKIVLPPISIDDPRVPGYLAARMRLPGRLNEISDCAILVKTVESITALDPNAENAAARIRKQLRDEVLRLVAQEFPNTRFSKRLLPGLFRAMGHESVDVQEGPSEAGSDLVVSLVSPLLSKELRIGVQAFAYSGLVSEDSLRDKRDHLLHGWKANQLDHGLLITTGDCAQSRQILEERSVSDAHPVRLIDASELADLLLANLDSLVTGP